MKISSKEFEHEERIPQMFTADGENVNPELLISEIPSETKSLVLIVEDPDSERVCGYIWVHWVRFNIPVMGSELVIEEKSLPGISGESTYHKESYGGPNPPSGEGKHNYHFKVFALSEMLNLQPMASLNIIYNEMKGKILEKADLIGIYFRA